MSRVTQPRHRLLGLVLVVGGLLLSAAVDAQQGGLSLPGAAPAPSDTDATATDDAVDARLSSLIETIEDPQKRDELLANLRALLAAHGEPTTPAAATAEDAAATLMEIIAERTNAIGEGAATFVDRLPLFVAWAKLQSLDPNQRRLWIDAGRDVAAVLGMGFAAFFVLSLALRPVRRRLAAGTAGGPLHRAGRVAVLLVVDLVPVLGLAVAAIASLGLVSPANMTRLVVLPLLQAAVIVRASVAVLRRLFAPKSPGLRPLPIPDAWASWGQRWAHRLTATALYSFFVLEAAQHLGLPPVLHAFLLHVLFLIVVAMAIVVIFQCRRPVAEAIASLAAEGRSAALRWLPWHGLAGIWHVAAMTYLLFVYVVWAAGIAGGFRTVLKGTLGSLLIALAAWLLLHWCSQVMRGDWHEPSEALGSGLERRLGRYLPALGVLVRVLVLVAAGVALLELWGLGSLRWLISDAGQILIGHTLTVTIVVIVTLVLWEVISALIERSVSEQDAEGNLRLGSRTRTLLNITRNFILVFLSLIALFLILSELGLNIAPLLAGAGVIGVAIGFGSQKLVQDIITGMFMLFGDTIRVGDVVEVSGRTGVVEAVTMRTVVLRDYGGNVHTIPYSGIDMVTNLTKDFSYAVFDIGVAYRESVDEVMRVMRDVGAEMQGDPYFRRLLLAPLEVAGVDKLADSAVIIRARFKTRPLRQWEVSREFNRRVKNRFDELGIEIPFPHQTVYFGVDKEGQAPPASLTIRPAEPGTGAAPASGGPKLDVARSGGG